MTSDIEVSWELEFVYSDGAKGTERFPTRAKAEERIDTAKVWVDLRSYRLVKVTRDTMVTGTFGDEGERV